MVAVRARLCDVMLATKNKRVDATEEVPVSVPGAATGTGKAMRFKVDVSAEGKRELEKMQKAAQQAAIDAYAPIVALSNVTAEDAATIKKPKKSTATAAPNSGSESPAQQDGATAQEPTPQPSYTS